MIDQSDPSIQLVARANAKVKEADQEFERRVHQLEERNEDEKRFFAEKYPNHQDSHFLDQTEDQIRQFRENRVFLQASFDKFRSQLLTSYIDLSR